MTWQLTSSTWPRPNHGASLCGADRILVAGAAGAGKTYLAKALAAHLDVPYVSQDALFFREGWTQNPEFIDDVAVLSAGSTWITELHFEGTEGLLVDRADALIWLTLPRWRSVASLFFRTLSRRVMRTPLWHGNTQGQISRAVFDRDGLIRWAWRDHHQRVCWLADVAARHPTIPVIQLSSRHAVRRFLRSLSTEGDEG